MARISWRSDTRILASSAESGSSSSSMRGRGRERAGQRDALLLAAGHLEREALVVAGEADELQHLLDAGAALGSAGTPAILQAEADIVLDIHVGEQRIGLEHHSDLALVGRQRRDVLALDEDGAGGRALEAGDHAQDRGLAAARGAEQRDELALVEGEVDALDDLVVLEGLGEVVDAGGMVRPWSGPASPGQSRFWGRSGRAAGSCPSRPR